MPSEQQDRDTIAGRFVATLGATMAAANYARQLCQRLRRRADPDHLPAGRLPSTQHSADGVPGGAWLLAAGPGSLGFMGVTELIGSHTTAVFTATLISMMSIAAGVQTGLLLWRAAVQFADAPQRRAFHD